MSKSTWIKIMPSVSLAFEAAQYRPTPLYVTQIGNVLFVRVGDENYEFEINITDKGVKLSTENTQDYEDDFAHDTERDLQL